MIYTTMDSNVKSEAKVAKKKKKVRNPRITVCYSPEDYATILEESTKAGIKKSQYIHDKSLEIMLYQLMNDEQTKALISLGDARSELVHIHNALGGKTQEELHSYFHDAEFMNSWIEATTYLIRRWGDIQDHFKYLQTHGG